MNVLQRLLQHISVLVLVVQYTYMVKFVCQAPSYWLCRYLVLRGLTTLHRWTLLLIIGKHSALFHVRMYVWRLAQKEINCYRLSYCSYISKRISSKRGSLVEHRYVSMDVLRTINDLCIQHTSYYRRLLYVQPKFFSTPPSDERHALNRAWTCRRLSDFAYFCVHAGRTSPWAGLPRVRSSRRAR